MSKPRVTAGKHIESANLRSYNHEMDHTTPNVDIEVSFDLHDHVAALSALERAVADVRSQIEETK